MKAYKGFNKDMTCRGFQFEEGKEYHEDNAVLCECGFHACENPLDCFNYYAPGKSVYHEVELDELSDKKSDDSKICGKHIKIGARLSVAKICELHFEYVKSRTTSTQIGANNTSLSGGYRSSLSGGYRSSLSGGDGSSLSGGDGSSLSGGYRSSLSGGYRSSLSGGYGSSLSGGDGSSLSGRGSASGGKNSIVSVRGNNVKAKGGIGSVLVIAEECNDSYNVKEWKAEIVDGEKIKPDTWYKLENGEFVEVKDET